MSKQLVDNIHKMNNPELIGLAKNRFLPGEVQLAIAKTGYRRAHQYLTENPGLEKSARDFMWSDECNKGYALKASMIHGGHYLGEEDKYWELYTRYPSAWNRSRWMMTMSFLGRNWYGAYGLKDGASGTPSDLLRRIYDDHYAERLSRKAELSSSPYYGGPSKWGLEQMAKHQNTDLPLAIRLSTCGVESVQKLAFQKIVDLSR